MISENKMLVFGLDEPKTYCPTPVIVILPAPSQGEPQYYGPFENGDVAQQWISKQPNYLRFGIIPLRNTERDRPNSDDWYFVRSDDDFDAPTVRSQ